MTLPTTKLFKFVESLLPPKIKDDPEVRYSYLFLYYFVAFFSLGAIVSATRVIYENWNVFPLYLAIFILVSSYILMPVSMVYLYYTCNLLLVSHFVLILMFSTVFLTLFFGGGYEIIFTTPIMVIPLLASFLIPSHRQVFCYLFATLAAWVYFYFTEPTESLFMSKEEIKRATFSGGIILMSFVATLGILFSRLRTIKQTILENQRDKSKQSALIKAELTRTISHELRTPLTSVMGLVDILYEDPRIVLKAHRDALHTIIQASDELKHLINSILEFSKLESHEQLMEDLPFDLSSVLVSTLQTHLDEMNEKKLKFSCSVIYNTEYRGKVRGDSHQLSKIIHNVLENCIKFSKSGRGGVITATLTIGALKGNQTNLPLIDGQQYLPFHFSFTDNGVGIDSVTLEKLRLFRPFTSVKSVHDSQVRRAGLGLPIAKHIAMSMNGDIYINSTLGEGTTVTVDCWLKKVT
eukprot:TRINITY_DN278_c0_g2_i14.p1 TRINITY_DN278_c0_g2~~TRINITY_DN278_c0_g2_i14.p1  ORF type:complete len:465 (+),score=82.06 TRINITY_DN278_c0_g2_i14:1072-2466(+)